jgi:hypothetical protein
MTAPSGRASGRGAIDDRPFTFNSDEEEDRLNEAGRSDADEFVDENRDENDLVKVRIFSIIQMLNCQRSPFEQAVDVSN